MKTITDTQLKRFKQSMLRALYLSITLGLIVGCGYRQTASSKWFETDFSNNDFYSLADNDPDMALTQVGSQRGITNGATRGLSLAPCTASSFRPECFQQSPHAAFIYYANVIKSHYPRINSFAKLQFGHVRASVDSTINDRRSEIYSGGRKDQWDIKIQSSDLLVPVFYDKPGQNQTQVIEWTQNYLHIRTATNGKRARLILAFRGNNNQYCVQNTGGFPWQNLGIWYWPRPDCNGSSSANVTITPQVTPANLGANELPAVQDPMTLPFQVDRMPLRSNHVKDTEFLIRTLYLPNDVLYDPWQTGPINY